MRNYSRIDEEKHESVITTNKTSDGSPLHQQVKDLKRDDESENLNESPANLRIMGKPHGSAS